MRAVSLAREAWAVIGTEGLSDAGSSGQPVAHHLLAIALRAEVEAARFGQTLGLEPQAPTRNAGGRPVGAVSAADRAADLTALPPPVDLSKLRKRAK